MEDKVKDITSHPKFLKAKSTPKLKNQKEPNYHSNFVDHGKEVREKKEAEMRVKREQMLAKWGQANSGAVDYHEFMQKVEKGETPTLSDLRELNRLKKDGFASFITTVDTTYNAYIKKQIEDL